MSNFKFKLMNRQKLIRTILRGIFFSLFAALYSTGLFAAPDEDPNTNLPPEEVAVRIVTTPVKPGFERSIFAPVQVFLYRADSEIEVIFNQNLGEVYVQIVNNMGIVVDSYSCDSFFEPFVKLELPSTAGYYTICIYGNSFHGTGSFTID